MGHEYVETDDKHGGRIRLAVKPRPDGARLSQTIRIRAWRAVDGAIRSGPPVRFDAILETMDGREIARLQRALRYERALGRAGHWAYDLNRHLALKQALWRLAKR